MKANDDTSYIESVVGKKESSTLEFIGVFDQDRVARVICSFLNGNGGQVVIGTSDGQLISGIEEAEEKAIELSSYLIQKIVPEAAVSVDIQTFKNKDLIVVNVWKGTNPPYIFNGNVYFRSNDKTLPANSSQLAELIHGDISLKGRWESRPAIEAEGEDIDWGEVTDCIKEISIVARDKNVPEEPLHFLNRYGLYKNGDFSNAAILLFGRDPVRLFPQIRVRLTVFKTNKSGNDIFYDRIFESNLFKTVRQVTEFFDLAYGVSSSFRSNEWKREDKLRFPRLPIREAILNAIVHRDYSSHSSSVAINIYSDRLEIINYGKLPQGITINSLGEDHLSVPVNPDIAHIFFLRKWIEKIGIGTLKMIAQCKELGFMVPVWSTNENSVKVIFPDVTVPFVLHEGITEGITEGIERLIDDNNNEGITEGVSKGITETVKESMAQIIKLLVQEESLRANEISERLNRPYKTVERHISTLKAINAIEYHGSNRTGGYVLSTFWKSWLAKDGRS
jgi:ATP-dependent DNA helicase RecG